MRKNELVNKHIIKAISVGLSAVMVCTPIPVYAAEPGEGNNNNGEQGNQNTNPVTKAASDAADAADTAVDNAGDASKTVTDDVEQTVSKGDVVSDGKDLSDAVKKAADDVDSSNFSDADTAVDNAETQIETAGANDQLAASQAGKADKEADNANTAADGAAKIAEDTNATVDEKRNAINNAGTKEDAEEAYQQLKDAVDAAQADFDQKLEDYNNAKEAAEEAAAKVAEYERAYQEALMNADANAKTAAQELEAAKKEAQDLEDAVKEAKDAVEKSAAGALEIKTLEDATRTTSLDWRAEDKLFIAIMKNYYLPEKLGIKDAEVKRIQGKDNNNYNYFTVTYKDDQGKDQVLYYNFKLEGRTHDVVIFEKREVEIFGDPSENPDQYVDEENNVISKDDLNQGLQDGTYVDVDGTYYEKNDATDSETLITNSTVTGTSTLDVSVDDSTKKETYKLDQDGNLVKEVTAEVTTITYTGNTFTSEDSYATDAERDAAAEKKKAELEEATGKDAVITETEEKEYTSSATYIPAFEATIDMDSTQTVLSSEGADEAIRKAKEEVTGALGEEYYILSTSFSDVNAEKEKDFSLLTDSYNVTGTATVTYAKVSKAKIDYSFFQGLGDFFTGSDDLEKAAKKWVEDNGGIYVGSSWVNGDFRTASIRYVKAEKATGTSDATKEGAEQSLKNAISDQLAGVNASGFKNAAATAYDVKTSVSEKTSYSYTVDYLEKTGESTETKAVATETYADAEELTGQIIQNLNYLQKKIKLTQYDEDYRKFVDDAAKLAADYERLLEEAKTANANVVTAQQKVKDLQDEIAKLKAKESNLNLDDLNAKLKEAEDNLKKAQDDWEDILEQLDDAGDDYEDVIKKLTPEEIPDGIPGSSGTDASGTGTTGTGTAGTGTAGTGTAGTTTATTVGGTTTVQTGAGAAGAQNANNAAGNANGTNIINIADEEVPLAASEDQDEKKDIVIADEEVPLAAFPTAEERATMSWWWLLLIAILGATGYKMYKEHEKKKEAQAEETK